MSEKRMIKEIDCSFSGDWSEELSPIDPYLKDTFECWLGRSDGNSYHERNVTDISIGSAIITDMKLEDLGEKSRAGIRINLRSPVDCEVLTKEGRETLLKCPKG